MTNLLHPRTFLDFYGTLFVLPGWTKEKEPPPPISSSKSTFEMRASVKMGLYDKIALQQKLVYIRIKTPTATLEH